MLEGVRNLVLHDSRLQLAAGFKFAYMALLQAMCGSMDYQVVSSACEGTLYKGFAAMLDQVRD